VIEGKVIYIAHNWSDASVSFQSKALALALSKKNKVFFLSAKKNGFHNRLINKNLLVLEWPGKRPTGLKDLAFAAKLMRKNRPDIVITNFAANDVMLFVSWLFHVRLRICYFHTMVAQYIEDNQQLPLKQKINIFRKSLVFRLATHMLPCSTAAKKDLLRYYKVKESRAFVFPNALPDTTFRNNNCYNKIGFLGRLDYSKGADILIHAFEKITNKVGNVFLEIAGSGKQESALREQVERLGICDKVFFRGNIPYSEVLHFLKSLNFLVVPSRMDNLPTVALEAFSVATPVIGSDAGGIPDIIMCGYNGMLFKSENVDDLSSRMASLLKNQEQRDILSVNARKVFEEKYCTGHLLERFEELLYRK